MAVAERLWTGGGKDKTNATKAEPRLAVHACRMKLAGFAVSPYSPSTYSMSGAEHWCTGDVNVADDDDYNGIACGACPAEWVYPSMPHKTDDVTNDTRTDVFLYQDGEALCYRIPSLVQLRDGRLLAFIEARNYYGDGCVPAHRRNVSQSGHAFIGYKVSTDGRTWGPFVNVTRGADFSPILTSSDRIIIQFPENHGRGQNMQIVSDPIASGGAITWGAPKPIGVDMGEMAGSNIGPGGGGGIELQEGARKGRLVFCGHGHDANDTKPPLDRQRAAFVLVSDDHGEHWRKTATFQGLNEW